MSWEWPLCWKATRRRDIDAALAKAESHWQHHIELLQKENDELIEFLADEERETRYLKGLVAKRDKSLRQTKEANDR